MIIWLIPIGLVFAAIIVFAGKFSSKKGNELEMKNQAAEKKNAITRGLDYKTYVKDGVIGMDKESKKVVYLKTINDTYIVLEFPFKNIHTIELLMDEEVLYKHLLKPGLYDESTIASIDGVMERHMEEYKKLRGDIMSVAIRLSVVNANNPIYSFNFYTKNVVANKSLLDLAINTTEAWGIQLIREIEVI